MLKQPIPFSTIPNMTFVVMVEDKGSPQLNSTATVFIEVIPSNANVPLFNSTFFEIEARSDRPVDSTVTSVTADDIDFSECGVSSFYYMHSATATASFTAVIPG
jgi:hypothetical protein